MKVTIYDVARAAKVSIATVSKVINRTGSISEKTRSRVLKVMEDLNYKPSVVASALTGKRTNTVGLLIPDLANPFFAEIARSVEDRGHEAGFNLMICSTDNDPDKESEYISLMRQKSVDGIILASGLVSDTAVKQLIDHQIPLAVIARDLPVLAVNAVLVDDFAGGYMAVSHLLSLGHRRIGVVAEDLRLMSSRERVRGYRHALEEAGAENDDSLVRVSDFTIEGGRRAALELLQMPDRPTALFACNDLLAIGAMRAAKELGLAIPEDLSVVGFDNTILAEIVDPGLTTVAQPIGNMGRQVVDLLIDEIQGEEKPARRVVLLPRLVERKSTAPVRSG
jgi:LacI family transcriptional regulator